mgnify:CR=1 FL=1
MTKAFLLKNTGKSDALQLVDFKLPDPTDNQVQIQNSYIAISHMDVHHRNGTYTVSELPKIIGISGCGTITKIGPNVTEFKPGEKVIYGTNFIGSYSQTININQNCLIGMPNGVPEDMAVASYVPGLTAHYLIYRAYRIKQNNIALVNGACGSVGHILCQWLSSLGVNVIGVVGNDSKVTAAKSYGCKFVINHETEDLSKRVLELTKNQGVNVVYDCYGKNAFEKNTETLTCLGLLVNYGDTTGLIDNFDVTKLWGKCLFYTKPNLSVYKGNRMELVLSVDSLYQNIKDKNIRPVFTTVNFNEIPKAHDLLESREKIGTIIARV